ncbi:flagellar motor protein MotB [Sphingomonas sp. 8AM]|uniref:flagellar motor protein MotB n=1 Tax=Sphingomonas sp. 8AM TaxID=2653170 RepID=UPI0012F2A82F|nr:flagellar motor protein MotB [Sphingomonas sp. 8AM]VXC32420.1 OmpA/MotB domain-containing protein [Sphingomonas sp. 8AM]
MPNTLDAVDAIVRPRRARNKRHQPVHHGGAWKVAYADFVTAMMAFFMLLWLLSNANKSQLKGLAEYFAPTINTIAPSSAQGAVGLQEGQSGRGQQNQTDAREPVGPPSASDGLEGPARGGTADIPDAALRVFADEMLVALQATPQLARNIRMRPERTGLRINLVDTANHPMFRGPTAELNDYARTLLTRVARQLARSNAQIAIEGHTDALGGDSDANWRLSGERALAARGAMVAAGMPASRFSEVVAKAGTEPIYPAQPARPENRRITIVALAEPSVLPRDTSFKF